MDSKGVKSTTGDGWTSLIFAQVSQTPWKCHLIAAGVAEDEEVWLRSDPGGKSLHTLPGWGSAPSR